MTDLTRMQHLDIIRALAEQSGGRFRFLNNTVPAYRRADGEWFKMEHGEVPDAFVAEQRLHYRISELPLHEDRLGGIAKIKDVQRMQHRIENLLSSDNVRSLQPSTIAQLIKSDLLEDGAVIPMGDFESQLTSILKRFRAIPAIVRSLEISEQVIAWPEHNLRLQASPIPDNKLVAVASGVRHFQSPEYLSTILLSAAQNHYMRPELFLMEVHAGLHNKNLALTFEGFAGNVSEIPQDVAHYLQDALLLYRENGKLAFDDAPKVLRMEYRPLDQNTRTISVEQGLSMLRAAMQTTPSPSLSVPAKPHQETTASSTTMLSRHLALRQKLWAYRGALNKILSTNSEISSEKINETWDLRMKVYPVSLSTPVPVLAELCARLEKIYGPLIVRESEHMRNELGARLLIHCGSAELESVLRHFQEIVEQCPIKNSESLDAFRRQTLLNDFLSPTYLSQQVEKYRKSKTLPSIDDMLGAISSKQNMVLSFDALPPTYTRK